MDKTGLLESIRLAHAPIEGAVAALDDGALLEPAPGMDGWTRKDVLAHMEWWNDHSARVVEALTTGREPYPWLGADDALYQTVVADSSEHYPEHLPHLNG